MVSTVLMKSLLGALKSAGQVLKPLSGSSESHEDNFIIKFVWNCANCHIMFVPRY